MTFRIQGWKLCVFEMAAMRGVMRFGKKRKLNPQNIGSFEIIEWIGEVAYWLALSLVLSKPHNVFHVSWLKKYLYDPSHILSYKYLDVGKPKLTYDERPMEIPDRKDKVLHNKTTLLVKVLWSNHAGISYMGNSGRNANVLSWVVLSFVNKTLISCRDCYILSFCKAFVICNIDSLVLIVYIVLIKRVNIYENCNTLKFMRE